MPSKLSKSKSLLVLWCLFFSLFVIYSWKFRTDHYSWGNFGEQAQEEEDANEKEQFFLRSGGLLLEKLISICHGSHNPIRTFSAKDLKKATNNYDSSLIFHRAYHCKWYKGSLEVDRFLFGRVGRPKIWAHQMTKTLNRPSTRLQCRSRRVTTLAR